MAEPLPAGGIALSEQPDIVIELVSNPAYLCGVREMLNLVSRRSGFNESQSSKIALAVDEALANVMNHGYARRPDGRIWVRILRLLDHGNLDGLRIVIEDEGRQVDPATIKSRDLADIRPGGLGVHIIKEIMDSVVYEKREGSAGMRLTLVKKLGTPGIASEATKNGGCCG